MHLAELLLNNWWVTKSQELLGIVISESTRSGSFALRMCSVWILKGTMLTLHIVTCGKSSVRLPGQTSGTFYFSHSCSFPLHPVLAPSHSTFGTCAVHTSLSFTKEIQNGKPILMLNCTSKNVRAVVCQCSGWTRQNKVCELGRSQSLEPAVHC